jgi:hypothetical protein
MFLTLFVVFLGGWVCYEMADFVFGDFFLYVDMVSGNVSDSCPPSIMRSAPGDQATETSRSPQTFIYPDS